MEVHLDFKSISNRPLYNFEKGQSCSSVPANPLKRTFTKTLFLSNLSKFIFYRIHLLFLMPVNYTICRGRRMLYKVGT